MIKNTRAEYDVAGIGSALLDLTVEVDEEVLSRFDLKKAEMHLIDSDMSKEILDYLSKFPIEKTPGGSSANTLAGVATLGGKSVFFGKVGSDEHGDLYIRETEQAGVHAEIGRSDQMTGHAITLITPDRERTFAVNLSAALQFDRNDIDDELIARSKILHFEGYLFELPHIREVCYRAIEVAKQNNVLISIDLSDPALIGRIHDTFKKVVQDDADIIFVNEDEALAFTGLEEEDALESLAGTCIMAIVKLGALGSVIKSEGILYRIPVFPTELVNTNGAGDIYAAGVLYGISRGFTPEKAARLGSYASSLVVAQVGARYNGVIDFEDLL